MAAAAAAAAVNNSCSEFAEISKVAFSCFWKIFQNCAAGKLQTEPSERHPWFDENFWIWIWKFKFRFKVYSVEKLDMLDWSVSYIDI